MTHLDIAFLRNNQKLVINHYKAWRWSLESKVKLIELQ